MVTVSTKGGYNEQDYNEPLYNDNDIYLIATETVSSTDANDTFDITSLKTETISVIDNLQKFFYGQIFADSVLPTDVLLNQPQLVKLETMLLSDVKTFAVLKVLLETMTLSDVRIMVQTRSLQEFIVLVDNLTKQIVGKRLNESIRLQDWTSLNKRPAANVWSD